MTCLACGCLCDDLAVVVGGGRVVEARRACDAGARWFLSEGVAPSPTAAMVEGQVVSPDEALDRAASILRRAEAPVVYGLTGTATETVREALGLADVLGARVLLNRGEPDLGRLAAFQSEGRVSATLGEVKQRADLVVFWGCDPVTSHPRHWERYSVEPAGRFLPNGRADRTVVVIDSERTATAGRADVFVPIAADRDFEVLTALRAVIRGRAGWGEGSGIDPAVIEDLASRMKDARYGALFFRSRREDGWGARAHWEAAIRLVRDLNEFTRFVLLGLGAPGNVAGAEAALTWQSGFAQGVDYRLGYPSPLDETASLDGVLASGEADALLVVADPLPATLSEAARARLVKIPRVVITPRATEPSEPVPTVALTSAACGIDAGGTVTRSDGVVLPLRPPLDPRFPSDGEMLRRLARRLQELGR